MIASVAPRLQSTYLTILEIGGAFGYRFKALIEFLGLTTLIITDLDSVLGPLATKGSAPQGSETTEAVPEPGEPVAGGDESVENEADDEEAAADASPNDEGKPGKACIASHPDAATSNQTLLQWLPKCSTVAKLWAASAEQKTQARTHESDALVRVAYQCRVDVSWGGETTALAGRTLEEAFALENLAWCQDNARKALQLRIAKADKKDLVTLALRIHKRVQASSFNKTDFALALLAEDPVAWLVPTYIAEGLRWLEAEIAPPIVIDDNEKDAPEMGAAGAETKAIAA